MDTYSIPGFSEPFSSLSHLLGAGIFAFAGVVLLRREKASRRLALGIFVFCCVFLLSMSGLYHLLTPSGAGRQLSRQLDHAAIFALIAGSFTPVHWFLFSGWSRWGVLILVWILAISGITLDVIFFDSIPEWLELTAYLGLGWIGLASVVTLWRRYGIAMVKPLAYSGLSYTAGGLLEFFRIPVLIPGVIGPHELLHIGVLAGIGFHYRFLFSIPGHVVAPERPELGMPRAAAQEF